ncbi:MAG: ParA family protein [Synechococcales cyanobacterium T60_A2020_003]|nr:ParA family protein [Synechococcales cyanobacterium T60_A2020_003]
MIITVVSFKGGVGKTTTAVHIAESLSHRRGRRVVLGDGDLNRTALNWYQRGLSNGLDVGFTVFDGDEDPPEDYTDLVIDTPARPDDDEIIRLANFSDLMLIPTSPAPGAIEAAIGTLTRLSGISQSRYRVLLTLVPPRPSQRGLKAQEALKESGIPTFKGMIQRRDVFMDAELEGFPVGRMKGTVAKLGAADYDKIGREVWQLTKERR